MRFWQALLLVAVLALIVVVARAAADDEIPNPPPASQVVVATPAPIVVTLYEGHTAEWWANRSRTWHRRADDLQRTLVHEPSTTEAINLACTIYGYCTTLWRKAECESRLYRFAANRSSSARGLFQFLTTGGKNNAGTWGSTPFGRFSVFSAYANALAAGWMHAHGRGSEWVCQ